MTTEKVRESPMYHAAMHAGGAAHIVHVFAAAIARGDARQARECGKLVIDNVEQALRFVDIDESLSKHGKAP